MKLRNVIGATALALLTSAALAQTTPAVPNMAQSGTDSATAASGSAATSNDPLVQKRIEDAAAKKAYKAEKKSAKKAYKMKKKVAKKDYKEEKQDNKATMKQDMANEPAKPGVMGQPGEYGQPVVPATTK